MENPIQQSSYLSQLIDLLCGYGVSLSAAQRIADDLIAHYSRQGRYYHNLRHLYHVLHIINSLRHLAEDYPAIQLAAWFHDVIYEVRPNATNEYASANYAVTVLKSADLPAKLIEKVELLILYTSHISVIPDEVDAQILMDADLSELAATPSEFERNAQSIRQEYQHVPDGIYYPKRIELLKQFLARQPLYLTPPIYEQCEEQARKNIEAALIQLMAQW